MCAHFSKKLVCSFFRASFSLTIEQVNIDAYKTPARVQTKRNHFARTQENKRKKNKEFSHFLQSIDSIVFSQLLQQHILETYTKEKHK